MGSAQKRWGEFVAENSALGSAGKELLYQDSEICSAFLATVAPDGGPRVHPVFPVIAMNDLWLFIVNMSPKYGDLKRNGWFALHAMPTAAGGEEFFVRGKAIEITDTNLRESVVSATDGRQGGNEFEALFRCELTAALHSKWKNWGTAETWPDFTKWKA